MFTKKIKIVVSIIILILVVGLGTVGWIRALYLQAQIARTEPQEVEEDTRIPVRTAVVRKESLQDVLTYEGFIQPSRVVMVVPKVPGRVSDIRIEVGASVKAGDVLLQLDTTELQAQVVQAEAGVKMAEASLRRVKSGAREEELEQVRELVEQARTGVESAQNAHDRMKILFEKGLISRHDYEMVKTQLDVAKSQLESAKQQLSLVESGAKQEDIEAVEAQLTQAQAMLTLAHTQLNDATIIAPSDGVVASVNCEVGELISSAMPAVVLIDLDTVKVSLGVGEKDVVKLKRGQSATVYVEALPTRKFVGVVGSVSPAADQNTRMFGVDVTLSNQDGALKAGMYAKVEIVTEVYENALVVPEQAITIDSAGRRVVYVVENGIVRIREVLVGMKQGSRVQILEGLDSGDEIVIDGQVGLVSGTSVVVRDGEYR